MAHGGSDRLLVANKLEHAIVNGAARAPRRLPPDIPARGRAHGPLSTSLAVAADLFARAVGARDKTADSQPERPELHTEGEPMGPLSELH